MTDETLEFGGWFLGQNVARSDTIHSEGIGIGDEVFMVGLFHRHTGRDRNEPIIRVGNIASLPSAPVPLDEGEKAEAILIEPRSIGGLSGSPVFVHMGYTRSPAKASQAIWNIDPVPFPRHRPRALGR